MRTGQEGIELIKEYEGFRAEAYLCPGGKWTIGYGHTQGVRQGDKITEIEAGDHLKYDVGDAELAVNSLIHVPLEQCQFDALVSLVYNIGCGNFHSSTIRRLVNEGCRDKNKITHAFKMWKKSNGRVLSGLIRRREAEAALYCKADGLEKYLAKG